MAQHLKAFAVILDALSLTPRTYMVEGGNPTCPLTATYVLCPVSAHAHTMTK